MDLSGAWGRVGRVLDEFYSKAYARISELLESGECEGNYLAYSCFGVYNALSYCAMMSFYTILGNYAPRIIASFFSDVEALPPVFSFEGTLLRDGRRYQVKVVVSRKSLNSVTKNRTVKDSARYSNPVILTLDEDEAFGVQELTDKLRWYDAYETWRLLTGDPYGLRTFRNMYRSRAREFRDAVRSLIKKYTDLKLREINTHA
jgi:hypothetical protein